MSRHLQIFSGQQRNLMNLLINLCASALLQLLEWSQFPALNFSTAQFNHLEDEVNNSAWGCGED